MKHTKDQEERIHYVGIGEIGLGVNRDQLKIPSLGSCIGLVIYPNDKNIKHFATMGHIMLPNSGKAKEREKNHKITFKLTKYADIAVPRMIETLEKATGSHRKKSFVAKMIGGAEMFGTTKLTFRIGQENVRVTKALLKKENISLIKEYTGGDSGMSVDFNVGNYTLKVKPTGEKSLII